MLFPQTILFQSDFQCENLSGHSQSDEHGPRKASCIHPEKKNIHAKVPKNVVDTIVVTISVLGFSKYVMENPIL